MYIQLPAWHLHLDNTSQVQMCKNTLEYLTIFPSPLPTHSSHVMSPVSQAKILESSHVWFFSSFSLTPQSACQYNLLSLASKYIGWGKSRFTVLSMWNKSLFLYYYLFITILFSIQTTVTLLLPHPVFIKRKPLLTTLPCSHIDHGYHSLLSGLLHHFSASTLGLLPSLLHIAASINLFIHVQSCYFLAQNTVEAFCYTQDKIKTPTRRPEPSSYLLLLLPCTLTTSAFFSSISQVHPTFFPQISLIRSQL